MRALDIFGGYGTIATTAFVLGLLLGGFPLFASEITILSLAAMMTLSLSNVAIGRDVLRGTATPTLLAILLNYVLLTGLILIISSFFNGELAAGWVLVAAVPSAVAVVPYTYMLGGDTRLSLVGTTVIYFLSLILAPLITIVFLGREIDRIRLVYTIVLMILIPIAVSQLPPLRRMSASRKTQLINICFGVLVFTMTGANRSAFTGDPNMVFCVSSACFVCTFLIGVIILSVSRARKQPPERGVAFVLFSSYKNTGLAAAVAMALIGPAAAIPATIFVPFEIFWLVTLKRLVRLLGRKGEP
jgi:BASS family bile acid:Na+ symporter